MTKMAVSSESRQLVGGTVRIFCTLMVATTCLLLSSVIALLLSHMMHVYRFTTTCHVPGIGAHACTNVHLAHAQLCPFYNGRYMSILTYLLLLQ